MWVQPLQDVWSNTHVYVPKISWTLPCSGRDWNACQTSQSPSFPFTSLRFFTTKPDLVATCCTLRFYITPCSTFLHHSSPYFPFLHCYTLTVKCHCFTECFFRSLYWYEMYLYGKIYMQYVRMLWAKQAYTHLFFCKWTGLWLTDNKKHLSLKSKHDRSERSHCIKSPVAQDCCIDITGLCYKHTARPCSIF